MMCTFVVLTQVASDDTSEGPSAEVHYAISAPTLLKRIVTMTLPLSSLEARHRVLASTIRKATLLSDRILQRPFHCTLVLTDLTFLRP